MTCDHGTAEALTESIDGIEWHAEELGLDGDDGRYNKANYEPEMLKALYEDIADCYDCSVDEITDEMFEEYVTPDSETPISQADYSYNRSTGISRYNFETIMRKEILERNENEQKD